MSTIDIDIANTLVLTITYCWAVSRARHTIVVDVGSYVRPSVRRLSHGHISKTNQDRPIVGTADSVAPGMTNIVTK